MKLSVCLIVKNEEKNLGRCLKSVYGIASEIVVIDTGSRDRTKEIAYEYGCKVLDFKWNNDFSAARNFSLENATGDWILFLDADEEMPREDLNRLIYMMEKEKKAEAYFLKMINFIKGRDVGSAIVLRAFKNRQEYRFVGRLHEQIINSIEKKYGIESIIPTQIRIFHYGYDPDIMDANAKSKRNLEILLTYPEDKQDGYYFYSLGNEYARINDYKKALKIYKKAIESTDYKKARQIYFPYLVLNIMKSYAAIKDFNEVIKTIEIYKQYLPDFKDMYFLGTLACIEVGKYTEGKRYIEEYISSKNSNYEYPNSNYDKIYDIKAIANELDRGSIDKSRFLIGCVILAEKTDEDILAVIKNINELVDRVIVLDLDSKNEEINKVTTMGAKLIKCEKELLDSILIKNLDTKWILILKGGEILPYRQQALLVEALNREKEKSSFKVEVLDLKGNSVTRETRVIFRNLLDNKTRENKEEYKIKEIDITIYKNYL